MQNYIWLNGFKSRLSSSLPSSGGVLEVVDKSLSNRLIEGYTYLVIDDGTGAEIVKAETLGDQIKITRGMDGTVAKAFPSGACVSWQTTRLGIRDTVCNKDFNCCKRKDDCLDCS